VVLEVVDHPTEFRYVVASGFGARAQWFRNVCTHPEVRLWVGRHRPRKATAHVLPQPEVAATLGRYAQAHPRAWNSLREIFETTLGAHIDTSSTDLPLVALDLDAGLQPSRRPQTPRSTTTTTIVALMAFFAVLLTGCSGPGGAGAAPGAPGPSVGQQLKTALPAPVRRLPLTTSTGERVDLAQYTGTVVVISDMMTLCQETCPLDTANIVAAARAVQRAGLADRVTFLSITIDPTRDTVSRLAAFRRLYRPAPSDWQLATGTPATLTALWRALGVFIKKVPDTAPAPKDWLTGKPLSYDLTHSDEVFFIDGHGRERFLLEGAPHVAPGAPIPAKLRHFLDAKGRANVTHPDPQAWTLPQELQVLSWLTGLRVSGAAP
jgi:protein SCO1/2